MPSKRKPAAEVVEPAVPKELLDQLAKGPPPQRRCGDQAAMAGASQHHGRQGTIDPGMEGGDESVRDPLR